MVTIKENANFSPLAWKISTKTLNSSSTIVENVVVRVFNKGTLALLVFVNSLEINCASWYAEKTDFEYVKVADKRANGYTREGRMLRRRQQQIDILEASIITEKLLSRITGIDDF